MVMIQQQVHLSITNNRVTSNGHGNSTTQSPSITNNILTSNGNGNRQYPLTLAPTTSNPMMVDNAFPECKTVPATPNTDMPCPPYNPVENCVMEIGGNIAVEQETSASRAFAEAWTRLKPHNERMDRIHKIFELRTWTRDDERYIGMNDALNLIATAEKYSNMSQEEWIAEKKSVDEEEFDDESGGNISNTNMLTGINPIPTNIVWINILSSSLSGLSHYARICAICSELIQMLSAQMLKLTILNFYNIQQMVLQMI